MVLPVPICFSVSRGVIIPLKAFTILIKMVDKINRAIIRDLVLMFKFFSLSISLLYCFCVSNSSLSLYKLRYKKRGGGGRRHYT